MSNGKYNVTVGPGSVIGAMSVGHGVKVEGTVNIGGARAVEPDQEELVYCKVEIRRTSRDMVAAELRNLANKIEAQATGTKAKGSVQDGRPGRGVAWSFGPEK